MLKLIVQLFGILVMQIAVIGLVHDCTLGAVPDVPKSDWVIESKFDSYGKCFAFVRGPGAQDIKHIVECQDTLEIGDRR